MKNKSKILTFAMALSVASLLFGASEAEAKTAYTKTVVSQGHTYQVMDQSMTFKKAKEYCEQRGGHLVTITSEKEQKVVNKLIKKER